MQRIFLWCSLIFLISFNPHLRANATEAEWETRLATYFLKSKTPYLTQLRFYTYLYAAQNDAATYSERVQNSLTELLVRRFFNDFNYFPIFESDTHSDNVAEDLLCPYLARMSLEDSNHVSFRSHCWYKKIPASVHQVARWLPWTSPLPFPPPPLDANDAKGWAKQFDQLKEIRQNLTQQQREILRSWVGKHGKFYHWRVMANLYMQEHKTPMAKALLVRAILTKGLYDGIIAEMRAKYTFCVPRPYLKDPSFKPIIPALHTPSYPSGHAVAGAVVAGILSHFFPEDHAYWKNLDEEGSQTRLWGGVHFPEDIEQGRLIGQKIAVMEVDNSAACIERLEGRSKEHLQNQQPKTYVPAVEPHAPHAAPSSNREYDAKVSPQP